MSKILVVADSHVTPDTSNERFEWLRDFILDQRPDTIIQLGDFASMESLSRWDRDKRATIEGRRLVRDLEAARAAWSIVGYGLAAEQAQSRRLKRRGYRPRLVWFEGNHENWLEQYVDRNAELLDFIDLRKGLEIDESVYSEFTWVPWKGVYAENGILFSHAPIGKTGPISSRYITTRALAEITNVSMVFGHTHRLCSDTIARYSLSGATEIRAISAGCFFEETPKYAEGNNNDYWRGVLLLHCYGEGAFDVEEWSLERLRRKYGVERKG